MVGDSYKAVGLLPGSRHLACQVPDGAPDAPPPASYNVVYGAGSKYQSSCRQHDSALKITDMQEAYAAIGRAVVAAQMFETALVPIFEFFKMHTKPGYLEKTGGYVSAGAFKVPIKSIVNMLSERGHRP